MRVGLDLDGCVYDFVDSFRRWLRRVSPIVNPSLPEPDRWNMHECWGMEFDEWMNHFRRGVKRGVIFGSGDPYPGALEALRRLRGAGHTLHIVTDRFLPGAQESTVRWLERHAIPHDTLTFSADKTIVRCDAFIDDKPAHVRALEFAGVPAALMDQPWNQEADDLFRVQDWAHFEKMVELIGESVESCS